MINSVIAALPQLREVVMKRARLIYNSNAGTSHQLVAEDILQALHKSGYSAHYDPTDSEEDLDAVLKKPTDLVVVAGGDGSFRAVAKRLLQHPAYARPAVTVLPLGTANNIATITHEATRLEILEGLHTTVSKPFDVGRVQSGEHEDIFLEAAGMGMFASMLHTYGPDEGKSVIHAAQAMVQTLSSFTAPSLQLVLDGQHIAGKFVLLEVMNTNAAGPRLPLAPNADSGDSLLDVVMISEDQRVGFLAYLNGLVRESLEQLPNVNVVQVKKLELHGEVLPIHVDADTIESPVMPITFEVLPGALELRLPARAEGAVTAKEAYASNPV
jgi:diacylglycerol kinase (ATP)